MSNTRRKPSISGEISAEQLRVAFELCPVAILLLSPSLEILSANPAAAGSLQRSDQQCSGASFLDYVAEPERTKLRSLELLRQGEELVVEDVVTVDGSRRFTLRKVQDCIVAVEQTTHHSQTNADPWHSDLDPLTGLPNRNMLKACLDAAIGRAEHDWGVLFIDLNDYKEVNDCYGHLMGDKVLAEFAEKLQASARPTDFVFRFGGDEFVMVVNQIASEQLLRRVAKRIQKEVSVRVLGSESKTLVVTASIGCAMAGPKLNRPEEIIDWADRDMYLAKRNSP